MGEMGMRICARMVGLMGCLTFAISLSLLGVFPGAAFAEGVGWCTPVDPPKAFGPYDYRVAPPEKLNVVEVFHFRPDMEALERKANGMIGQDLTYTLRYFPNHHRALATLVRLAKRDKTNKPTGMERSVECYFDLALRFVPDDGMVHLLYGLWLVESGDKKGAEVQLAAAKESVSPDNPNAQYNLGLGWFALGRYDEALAAAHAAYGMGYQLPGLKQKLEKVGKWQAVPPKAAASANSGSGDGEVAPPAQGKEKQ